MSTLLYGTLIGVVIGMVSALVIYVAMVWPVRHIMHKHRDKPEPISTEELDRIEENARVISKASSDTEQRVTRIKDLQRLREQRIKETEGGGEDN